MRTTIDFADRTVRFTLVPIEAFDTRLKHPVSFVRACHVAVRFAGWYDLNGGRVWLPSGGFHATFGQLGEWFGCTRDAARRRIEGLERAGVVRRANTSPYVAYDCPAPAGSTWLVSGLFDAIEGGEDAPGALVPLDPFYESHLINTPGDVSAYCRLCQAVQRRGRLRRRDGHVVCWVRAGGTLLTLGELAKTLGTTKSSARRTAQRFAHVSLVRIADTGLEDVSDAARRGGKIYEVPELRALFDCVMDW